jgi:hypothetical protein
MTIGNSTKKTTVMEEAGKTPVWNDILTFSEEGDWLKITAMDEDVGKDDNLGTGVLNIRSIYEHPNEPQACTFGMMQLPCRLFARIRWLECCISVFRIWLSQSDLQTFEFTYLGFGIQRRRNFGEHQQNRSVKSIYTFAKLFN